MEMIERQNFISVDRKTVRNSYGEFFTVGERVNHEDKDVDSAVIMAFEPNIEMNEVKVITDKGYAYVDFLVKIKENLKFN